MCMRSVPARSFGTGKKMRNTLFRMQAHVTEAAMLHEEEVALTVRDRWWREDSTVDGRLTISANLIEGRRE